MYSPQIWSVAWHYKHSSRTSCSSTTKMLELVGLSRDVEQRPVKCGCSTMNFAKAAKTNICALSMRHSVML